MTEALNDSLFKLADFSVLIVFAPYYSPGTLVKEKENFLQLTRTTVDNFILMIFGDVVGTEIFMICFQITHAQLFFYRTSMIISIFYEVFWFLD